jgi:hypothetical protein
MMPKRRLGIDRQNPAAQQAMAAAHHDDADPHCFL